MEKNQTNLTKLNNTRFLTHDVRSLDLASTEVNPLTILHSDTAGIDRCQQSRDSRQAVRAPTGVGQSCNGSRPISHRHKAMAKA